MKVSKGAKIKNRYNQVPHLTQDTNGKVTNSQLDTTNESPFPAGEIQIQAKLVHVHLYQHCKEFAVIKIVCIKSFH